MTKLTKMIYICSPYSSYDPDEKKRLKIQNKRYKDITRITGELQDIYPYAFIGPITQSHNTAKYMKSASTAFKAWAKRDLTYVSKCDEVWVIMLDGWEKSKGVKAEIKFALKNNISVSYIDPVTKKYFLKTTTKLIERNKK